MAFEPVYILRGVAGSNAHGLATPDSDIDTHGVYSYPTEAFWSLIQPRESIVTTNPDGAFHELAKFLKLAAAANPAVLEDLHLEDYLEKEPFWGDALLDIRSAFLSAKRVRGTYEGYARSQYHKFIEREGSFSSSTRKKTAKHAKHIFRLMEQGQHLYTTGELRVRVEDPQKYFDYMEMDIEDLSVEFRKQFAQWEDAKTVLPAEPDFKTINAYLADYRLAHVKGNINE